MSEQQSAVPWIAISRGIAMPWHCDHYGHMNVRWYAHAFDDATLTLWSCIGIDMREIHASGAHTVIGKSTTNYRQEITAGDPWQVFGAFTRMGTKSVTAALQMKDAATGLLRAEHEAVIVFFDPETRTSAPIPQACRDAVAGLLPDDVAP
ncbi:MAG: acyl-CoA thioesterase [Gammaproteobacteria bacterium]